MKTELRHSLSPFRLEPWTWAALAVFLPLGILGSLTTPPARAAVPATTPHLALPAHPRVLLVGDSYTEGVGAVPLSKGYAFQIAKPLGWTLTIDGVGGSGYINTGANPGQADQGTYADRLWRHRASSYDLIVLEGGSNDNAQSQAQIAGAVNMTIRTEQRLYPHAELLILGPSSPYGNTADRVRVDGILSRYAGKYTDPYVSPVGENWFRPADRAVNTNPANGHPSNAGHALIAARFVAGVKVLES